MTFDICVQARSDHADLVSRRMGFIPLPLACLVGNSVCVCVYVLATDNSSPTPPVQIWNTLYQSFSFPGPSGSLLLSVIYSWLVPRVHTSHSLTHTPITLTQSVCIQGVVRTTSTGKVVWLSI